MMSMDQRTKITSKLIIAEIRIFPPTRIHLSCLQRSILALSSNSHETAISLMSFFMFYSKWLLEKTSVSEFL
ncbi:hypothetical protein OIU79_018619 [Salix purpurea]|uniref:Uncharacterized protein n=1 Tax=Salix purpurea TaxID=77065 RepID=A0A9Q0WXS8_SALPP|nr:hypothetical protein OIU79_018619 [Salix purpurea]